MYEKQERITGEFSTHTRRGCKLQFNDTRGTPLEGDAVRLGLIFWALYLPADQLVDQLRERGDTTNADRVSQVVQGLGKPKDADFWARMRPLATVFCGRILLEDYPKLVSNSGKARFLMKLHKDTTGCFKMHEQKQRALDQAVRQTIEPYERIYSKLGVLQRLDTACVRGRAIDREQRNRLAQELTVLVQQIVGRELPGTAVPEQGWDHPLSHRKKE